MVCHGYLVWMSINSHQILMVFRRWCQWIRVSCFCSGCVW